LETGAKAGGLGYRGATGMPDIGSRIIADMRSAVAEAVRSRRTEEEQRLSPVERLQLALRMGEASLALFMSANSLSREEALRELEANKQKGRRPSCNSPKLR
jgi:hypothetical protein